MNWKCQKRLISHIVTSFSLFCRKKGNSARYLPMSLRYLLVPELMAPASRPIALPSPTIVVTDQPVCSGTLVRTSFVGVSIIIGRHTPQIYWAARNASSCSTKQARIWLDKPSAAPTPATPGGGQQIVLVQCIGKNPCIVQRFAEKGKFEIVPPGSVQQLCPLDTLWLVRGVCPLRLCVLKATEASDLGSTTPLASRDVLNAMIAEALASVEQNADRGAALCCGPLVLQCSPGGTHVSSSIPGSRTSTGAYVAGDHLRNISVEEVVVVDGSSSKKRERSCDSQPVLIAPPAAFRSSGQDDEATDGEGGLVDDERVAKQLVFSGNMSRPIEQQQRQQQESEASSLDDASCCDSQLARLEAFAGVMQSTKRLGPAFFQQQPSDRNGGVIITRGSRMFETPAPLMHGAGGGNAESQLVFFDHNV